MANVNPQTVVDQFTQLTCTFAEVPEILGVHNAYGRRLVEDEESGVDIFDVHGRKFMLVSQVEALRDRRAEEKQAKEEARQAAAEAKALKAQEREEARAARKAEKDQAAKAKAEAKAAAQAAKESEGGDE